LEQWLTDHLRGAQADWTHDGRACSAELVLRIAPTTLQVSLEPQFEHQYRTI
jgi:hypothetical protein